MRIAELENVGRSILAVTSMPTVTPLRHLAARIFSAATLFACDPKTPTQATVEPAQSSSLVSSPVRSLPAVSASASVHVSAKVEPGKVVPAPAKVAPPVPARDLVAERGRLREACKAFANASEVEVAAGPWANGGKTTWLLGPKGYALLSSSENCYEIPRTGHVLFDRDLSLLDLGTGKLGNKVHARIVQGHSIAEGYRNSVLELSQDGKIAHRLEMGDVLPACASFAIHEEKGLLFVPALADGMDSAGMTETTVLAYFNGEPRVVLRQTTGMFSRDTQTQVAHPALGLVRALSATELEVLSAEPAGSKQKFVWRDNAFASTSKEPWTPGSPVTNKCPRSAP
jgi:hypothetical protein